MCDRPANETEKGVTDEIKVTPDMPAAGFRALVAFGPADEADDVTLAEVFRAMLRSAPRCYREEWSRSR
jgi:hypothetical protein